MSRPRSLCCLTSSSSSTHHLTSTHTPPLHRAFGLHNWHLCPVTLIVRFAFSAGSQREIPCRRSGVSLAWPISRLPQVRRVFAVGSNIVTRFSTVADCPNWLRSFHQSFRRISTVLGQRLGLLCVPALWSRPGSGSPITSSEPVIVNKSGSRSLNQSGRA